MKAVVCEPSINTQPSLSETENRKICKNINSYIFYIGLVLNYYLFTVIQGGYGRKKQFGGVLVRGGDRLMKQLPYKL